MVTDAPPRIVSYRERDPRLLWRDEARDFTPWLAENISYLEKAIGLDLDPDTVVSEREVGPFRADLTAQELDGDRSILVENQLSRTDHDHLGKLMTYASGVEARVAIWIATEFQEEHRSALTWMNEVTDADVAFFGFEIQVVALGDRDDEVAVRLEPVVEPDRWRKRSKEPDELSPRNRAYREFWSRFLDRFHEEFPAWSRSQTPPPQSWFTLPAGRGDVHYSLSFAGSGRFRVEVYTPGETAGETPPLWDRLHERRDEIERRLREHGIPDDVLWEPLESSQASRIALYLDDVDVEESDWDPILDWAIERLGAVRGVFQPLFTGPDALPR